MLSFIIYLNSIEEWIKVFIVDNVLKYLLVQCVSCFTQICDHSRLLINNILNIPKRDYQLSV